MDLRRGETCAGRSLGAEVAIQVSLTPCDIGARPLHHQLMQATDVGFGEGRGLPGEFAHLSHRVIVVEGFQVVLQRFDVVIVLQSRERFGR